MIEERQRKPGSVRLTDGQYQEMERLGIDNESAYVKYKLNGAQQHLQVLRKEEHMEQAPLHPSKSEQLPEAGTLADKLALQKFKMENEQLKNKLDEIAQTKNEALDGIHGQVSSMLRDELLKRDFEESKKETSDWKKR